MVALNWHHNKVGKYILWCKLKYYLVNKKASCLLFKETHPLTQCSRLKPWNFYTRMLHEQSPDKTDTWDVRKLKTPILKHSSNLAEIALPCTKEKWIRPNEIQTTSPLLGKLKATTNIFFQINNSEWPAVGPYNFLNTSKKMPLSDYEKLA